MDERKERSRTLARLAGGFGLMWVCTTMLSAPGPAAWVALSGSTSQAGAYFAVISASSAFGAMLGGRAMDRWGRRPVLVGAYLSAASGFALAGVGYALGSLPAFGVATSLSSASIGTIFLTRLAAGEIQTAAERASAVARVQVSATAGALVGPFLLVPLREPLLLWGVAPPLLLVGAALVAGARGLRGATPRNGGAPGDTSPIPLRPFLAAAAALMTAHAAMVTVMGVSGVELHHAGHGHGSIALVMALHFLGMFGLSLVIGRFADRAGRSRTIAIGLTLVAAGGAAVAFLPGAVGLAAGLFAVGLGWSFSYLGATVLLTDIVPAARRARVMGGVDFTTSLLAAVGSFSGGLWYAERGVLGLGLAAAALVALPWALNVALREPSPGRFADTGPSSDPML